jgi:hypothetical protein
MITDCKIVNWREVAHVMMETIYGITVYKIHSQDDNCGHMRWSLYGRVADTVAVAMFNIYSFFFRISEQSFRFIQNRKVRKSDTVPILEKCIYISDILVKSSRKLE